MANACVVRIVAPGSDVPCGAPTLTGLWVCKSHLAQALAAKAPSAKIHTRPAREWSPEALGRLLADVQAVSR